MRAVFTFLIGSILVISVGREGICLEALGVLKRDVTMRTLVCSLAAALSVALGSGTLAAAEEVVVTGTVSFYEDGSMEINRGNERRPNLLGPIYFPGLKPPKEGEKVRVHGYYIHGPTGDFLKMIATKIEKVGEADGGSNKK